MIEGNPGTNQKEEREIQVPIRKDRGKSRDQPEKKEGNLGINQKG